MRIHFVVRDSDKVRYQSQARREGKSLGAWLREAAEEKLAEAAPPRRFTPADLERFNAECDAREAGAREPDWPEYKRLVSESQTRGTEVT